MRPTIGLFCSASDHLPQSACDLAADFGRLVAEQGVRLAYGGSARGLMGIAARAAHAAGGEVIGFMVEALSVREQANANIGTLHHVPTLDDRKRAFAECADAFVALPGGIGTLDEITEMLTLDDIGAQAKPMVLCDNDGFWDPFFAMLERFGAYGVLRPALAHDLLRARGAAEAMGLFARLVPAAASGGAAAVLR
ncbi:MAG TPA: TIGR00730 family Rossman fold protein [Burkholderiales bacterium]|jgi:hypothetical protein